MLDNRSNCINDNKLNVCGGEDLIRLFNYCIAQQ